MKWIAVLLFAFLAGGLFAEEGNPLDYYRIHFEKKAPHPLADTLFEKTIWHRKVSHLVIEERASSFLVTCLMVLPYPHNYKSHNYRLHYRFKTYAEAFQKFRWLNDFLEAGGVARVRIRGNDIVEEKILYKGDKKKRFNRPIRDADAPPSQS